MAETQWATLGLDDDTVAELNRRGTEYARDRIHELHRDDAVQNGLCRVLYVVMNPPGSYPEEPAERMKYLTACLYNEIARMSAQNGPGPTVRLPAIPTL